MPVPSLRQLAKAKLVANIHMLHDIGELPYDFLADVLRHIQSPDKLLELETNCPQLLGETGEIWLRFIKRDIPDWETKPHEPRDPTKWSKVYRKLAREAEIEKAEQEEQLKEKMRALQQNKQGNQTRILENRILPDPSRRRTGGGGGWGTPGAPAKTGKALFDKIKRGVWDQKQGVPKAAKMPAHLLQQRKGIVRQAPARLVRMKEAEAPRRMAVPQKGAAAVTGRNSATPGGTSTASPRPRTAASPPSLPNPKIRQVKAASPPKPPSLPPGHQFSPPKIRTQTTGGEKRKKEGYNPLMPIKRKKL